MRIRNKIFRTKAEASAWGTQYIMVKSQRGDNILYSLGRPMGAHIFFDDRLMGMSKTDFENDYEPVNGEDLE